MIKSEKQYRITKAQIRRFQDAVADLARQKRPANVTPRLWQAQREAAQSQFQELQEQVEAYERLHVGKSKELTLEAVEDLPKTLIQARIASGLTGGAGREVGHQDPASAALRSYRIRERKFRAYTEGRRGAGSAGREACAIGPQRVKCPWGGYARLHYNDCVERRRDDNLCSWSWFVARCRIPACQDDGFGIVAVDEAANP